MATEVKNMRIYDGDGDRLMAGWEDCDKIMLLPDTPAADKHDDPTSRIRIMWGDWLIEDLLAHRYRSVVCAVNAEDNSHGIITQLADVLPTSQWHESSITAHAKRFVQPKSVTVVKYDMDAVIVLALLRPADHSQLTLDDLGVGFRMVSEMLVHRRERLPTASVCFLGAQANRLVEDDGREREPSFESVLRTMYDNGYHGDVYPATWMWEAAPTGVFARYPFPESLDRMRTGGF